MTNVAASNMAEHPASSRPALVNYWPWLFVAAFVAMPLLTNDRYFLDLMVLFFVWALVVTQWNLVLGHAGIFSLVQFAIFNLGGYFTAVAGTHYGITPAWSLPMAGVFCAVFGLLIGLACLRLRGAYVTLITFAAHSVVYLLIFTDTSGLTGGGYGLYGFGDYGFREYFGSFGALVADYYVALALLVVSSVVAVLVMKSPLGLAFRALRDSEGLAGAIGISRFRYQLTVFVLTAFFIGIAGSFYGTHLGSVDPNGFDFGTMLMLVVMIVIGGIGTSWGPILGCALMMILVEFLRDVPEYRNMTIGGAIMIFMVLCPLGIVDPLSKLFRRKPARTAG